MTNEQRQVRDWMVAFGQECPDKPTIPSREVRYMRAKLILEEALETIDALGFEVGTGGCEMEEVQVNDDDRGANLEKLADGCEDLKVVTEGTLVACGLVINTETENGPPGCGPNLDPLFDEVMRSNWSKMWTEQELDEQPNDFIKSHQIIRLGIMKEQRDFLVKDHYGKVIKAPSCSPPSLQPIIDSMSG